MELSQIWKRVSIELGWVAGTRLAALTLPGYWSTVDCHSWRVSDASKRIRTCGVCGEKACDWLGLLSVISCRNLIWPRIDSRDSPVAALPQYLLSDDGKWKPARS